jgi:hypothetical protein
MEVRDLEQAISNLTRIIANPSAARGCRASLVSFVWIDTLLHHWPSKSTAALRALRDEFAFLKNEERSRFLKQRRIVLNHLVRSFEVS